MKQLKTFLIDVAIAYLVIEMLSVMLAFYLKRDYNRELVFAKTSLQLFYIALLVSGAINLLRMEKINIIIRLIIGYALLIPTGFILRDVFGVTVFRTPLILIYALIMITVIYIIFLWIAKSNLSKEAKELNDLITK